MKEIFKNFSGPIRSKIKSIKGNEKNKELISHSILAILARGGGAVASFLMNIVIARYLGANEAGYFFLALTITTLIATVGRLGADNAVLRFVSVHSERQEWDDVHGIVSVLLKWVWIITGVVGLLMAVFARPISEFLFHKDKLTWPLFWAAWSVPFMAIYNVLGMALQARRKVLLSVTVLKIVSPIALIVIAFALSPKDSNAASIYYTVSNVVGVIFSYWWWKRNVPPGKGTYDFKKLWKTCIPLWLGSIMNQLVIWGGQFVAGIYNSSTELAQLAVARNTSILINFIMTAINYVSAPRFAAMYADGKMEELKKYARNTTWFMTLVATPVLLFVWIWPGFIMSLFGRDFVGGYWLLRILALGQYINVITGSVSYLLIMSGHESQMLKVRTYNAIGAVALAFILNPIFGVIGSAVASTVAMAAQNFLELGLVKKYLGFSTMDALGIFK